MKKTVNKIKTFFGKPYNVLLLFFVTALTYLVVLPLFSIVSDTFTVHSAEKARVGQAVGTFIDKKTRKKTREKMKTK